MVVAQTGLRLKVLQADKYAVIVFMAVVAAGLAPPLLRWAFRKVLEDGVGAPSAQATGE